MARDRRVNPQAREPEALAAAKVDSLRHDQERLFVYHYILTLDAQTAALNAGYALATARTKAYTWVTADGPKPWIYEAVQDQLNRHAKKLEITAERVLQGLAQLAFSNPLDFGSVNDEGEFSIDLSRTSRDQFTAVTEITSKTTRIDGAKPKKGQKAEQPRVTERVTKLKLADRRAPLVDLGRHLGVFKEDGGGPQTVTFIIKGLEAKSDAA